MYSVISAWTDCSSAWIDLDDLLDLAAEITCQQIADHLHLVSLASAIDFDSIVPQCIPVFQVHERRPVVPSMEPG